MNKSDQIGQLAEALCQAQGMMKFAKKDSSNPFFKSKYADLSSVVEAIRLPLYENGLSYAQTTDTDEHGVIVETVLMHKSGEWISGRLKMVPVKNDPQGIGSCITYARRYGLQSMVGIPTDDDDGNAASHITPTAGALERLPAKRQVEINETAALVRKHLTEDNAWEAYNLIETSNFEPDEKTALWSLLDSKQRAALKKLGEAEKATVENKISATQKKRLEARISEIGADREAAKAYCKKRFGKEHFTELTKEEYDILDVDLPSLAPKEPAAPQETMPDTERSIAAGMGNQSASKLDKAGNERPSGGLSLNSPATAAAPDGLITKEQIREIETLLDMKGIDKKRFLMIAKVKSVDEIKAERFDGAISWLDRQGLPK